MPPPETARPTPAAVVKCETPVAIVVVWLDTHAVAVPQSATSSFEFAEVVPIVSKLVVAALKAVVTANSSARSSS